MDETNTVRRAMTKAFVKDSYRHNWLEADLNITGEYTIERNDLRPDMDRNPWRISPGAEFIFSCRREQGCQRISAYFINGDIIFPPSTGSSMCGIFQPHILFSRRS